MNTPMGLALGGSEMSPLLGQGEPESCLDALCWVVLGKNPEVI